MLLTTTVTKLRARRAAGTSNRYVRRALWQMFRKLRRTRARKIPQNRLLGCGVTRRRVKNAVKWALVAGYTRNLWTARGV